MNKTKSKMKKRVRTTRLQYRGGTNCDKITYEEGKKRLIDFLTSSHSMELTKQKSIFNIDLREFITDIIELLNRCHPTIRPTSIHEQTEQDSVKDVKIPSFIINIIRKYIEQNLLLNRFADIIDFYLIPQIENNTAIKILIYNILVIFEIGFSTLETTNKRGLAAFISRTLHKLQLLKAGIKIGPYAVILFKNRHNLHLTHILQFITICIQNVEEKLKDIEEEEQERRRLGKHPGEQAIVDKILNKPFQVEKDLFNKKGFCEQLIIVLIRLKKIINDICNYNPKKSNSLSVKKISPRKLKSLVKISRNKSQKSLSSKPHTR